MTSLIVPTVVFGSALALLALSFTFSYRIVRFANFAHVEYFTIGAYVGITLDGVAPLWVSLLAAMLAGAIVALAMDLAVFQHLTQASMSTKMIASAGLMLLLRFVIQFIWGVQPRTFSLTSDRIEIGPLRFSQIHLLIVVIAFVSVFAFAAVLRSTSLGRNLRAVADSHSLVQARGVNAAAVIRQSWLIAGAMAGLGGVLLGLDTFVRPDLGNSALLAMFAAVVVGGLGSPVGALVGSFILAFGQNLILYIDFGNLFGGDSMYLGSHYKQVFAFGLLVLILLVKPTGLFGEIEERA